MRTNLFEIVKNNMKELSYPSSKGQSTEGAVKTPVLPRGFEPFIESDFCLEMADSIMDYCKYLIGLEHKKEKLEADAKSRLIPAPRIL